MAFWSRSKTEAIPSIVKGTPQQRVELETLHGRMIGKLSPPCVSNKPYNYVCFLIFLFLGVTRNSQHLNTLTFNNVLHYRYTSFYYLETIVIDLLPCV